LECSLRFDESYLYFEECDYSSHNINKSNKKEIRGAFKDLPIRVPQTMGFIYPQIVGLLPSQILEKSLSFVLY